MERPCWSTSNSICSEQEHSRRSVHLIHFPSSVSREGSCPSLSIVFVLDAFQNAGPLWYLHVTLSVLDSQSNVIYKRFEPKQVSEIKCSLNSVHLLLSLVSEFLSLLCFILEGEPHRTCLVRNPHPVQEVILF